MTTPPARGVSGAIANEPRHVRPAAAEASGTLSAPHRWENRERGRYYELRLVHDLFGELQLMRVWGGIGNARGALRWQLVADAEVAGELLARTAKRRTQRGYQPVCLLPT